MSSTINETAERTAVATGRSETDRNPPQLDAAIVRATSAAARSRGAEPLFIVPSFGPPRPLNEHPEAPIVQELFEQQAQPYLLIDIPQSRMMPENWHPDAIAARDIAAAAEHELRPRLHH